jgi:hypothetical protein
VASSFRQVSVVLEDYEALVLHFFKLEMIALERRKRDACMVVYTGSLLQLNVYWF